MAVLVLGVFALSIASFSSPYVVQIDPAERESKVTFNAPFTIHFSHMMKQSSVEEAFKIVPKIEGHFEWKDLKTLEFHPDEELEIDDEYLIVIKSSAKSLWLKSLGLEATLNYLVTGPPYVLFANPMDGGLLAKGEAITFMFDRPMAFLDIGGRKLIETNPKVRGSIRYMGLSAFQFIPDKLPANQDLLVSLPAGLKALDGGVTEATYEIKLRTPNLSIEISIHFSRLPDIQIIRRIKKHIQAGPDVIQINLVTELYC